MKNKILLLTLVLFTLLSISAKAQWKGFSVGPYLEAAIPKGDFAQSNRNGIGVGVAADIKLGGKLAATGSYGVIGFGRRPNEGGSSYVRVSARPLRAGLKYKLPLVYLKMESGVVHFKNEGGSGLILSPGLGIRVFGLDVQGSYESWLAEEGRSFASLKVAYHF
jgi:hypothetical protein